MRLSSTRRMPFFPAGAATCSNGWPRQMQNAAEALDFEAAALIRDRIRALSLVQGHQDIHVAGVVDADVIAAHQAGGQTCVQVFFFRGGQNWGNRAYFPSHDRQLSVEEVLTSFVGQFYDNRAKPRLVSAEPSTGRAGAGRGGVVARAVEKVTLAVPQRGDKKRLIDRDSHDRPRGARPAACRERLAAPAARRCRGGLRHQPGFAARRGLRQQPYPGHQCGWRDDRRRSRRAR